MSQRVQIPVYLDFNATTPVDIRVFDAMQPYFVELFGNAASSSHGFGIQAREAVDTARQQVARLIGTTPSEIVWTSGSTESINLAVKGAADAHQAKGRHIITQATEHKAVLDCCKILSNQGFDVTFLPTDGEGLVSADDVVGAIRPDTILCSIMWANNEIGTVQPIREIALACRARGVLFHTDATQAAGKLPVNVVEDSIDLLSLSGHKMYGPKGTGILYVRKGTKLTCQLDGGGHEGGFRSGTLNVPGIIGVGAACDLSRRLMATESPRLAALRDKLEQELVLGLGEVTVNGSRENRLPHVTNLSFAGVNGLELLPSITDEVAVSSGSACTSASMEASYVLKALGRSEELAYASIRFSLGRKTTEAEIDFVIEKITGVIQMLRARHGAALAQAT